MKSERILILPKGDYESTAQYEVLDLIYYEGSYYMCIKNCAGITPDDEEYWKLFVKADQYKELGLSIIDGKIYDSWEVEE